MLPLLDILEVLSNNELDLKYGVVLLVKEQSTVPGIQTAERCTLEQWSQGGCELHQ